MISHAIEATVIRALAALERERGQAFVEYILLLVALGLALAVTYTLFAGDIANNVATIANRLLGS